MQTVFSRYFVSNYGTVHLTHSNTHTNIYKKYVCIYIYKIHAYTLYIYAYFHRHVFVYICMILLWLFFESTYTNSIVFYGWNDIILRLRFTSNILVLFGESKYAFGNICGTGLSWVYKCWS